MAWKPVVNGYQLAEAQRRAQARALDVHDRVARAALGTTPDHVQLGNWYRVRNNPTLQAQIKAQRGDESYAAYERAMQELEKKLAERKGDWNE